MTSENFYQELPSFEDFNQITELSHFREIPGDWVIFVADVKGSTQAIEEGRYKDVNTIGAACIVCAQNSIGDAEFLLGAMVPLLSFPQEVLKT